MVDSRKLFSLRGLLAASLLAVSFSAKAAPLDLTLLDTPDIASFFINLSYDASNDTLSADGYALSFAGGGGSEMISSGLFMLDATIDSAGNLVNGTISIAGTIAALGYNSGTLLTGTLSDFGFGSADTLEFLFTPTGGDLLSLYGASGGIIMGQTGFGGSFDENFGTAVAVADVAAIPVPAAVWLMLSALAGLVGLRRR